MLNFAGREKVILILTGIVVVVCGILVVAGMRKPATENNTMPNNQANQQTSPPASVEPTQGGLQITDETVGTGAEATNGATLTMNYIGTLTDGTKFDSSYDRNQPFNFTLGAGQVIPGWDQGIAGMKVGGKRKLIIPPSLGYGSQAAGSIPPNSTLIFEVELLDVK